MLAVSAALPDAATDRPPIVLAHGSASSASVWTFWQRELAARGWASYAVDLRGHGASRPADLSRVSMHDYAADVRSLAAQLSERPIVIGWSMGGLVAMIAASTGEFAACVGLAPSVPARSVDTKLPLREGEFGPEEYGITSLDPADQAEMPDLDREEREVALASVGRESRYARDERKRGIVIESLPCPLLIVTGTADRQWPRERYDGLWLEADYVAVEGASHWGMVLSRRALTAILPDVLGWLEAAT
ncbi:MAG: alpha/beta hydrolase [Chloroflexi bacterium]|nr:alpha/beta hydrolase [Chloroflexota bacterium]